MQDIGLFKDALAAKIVNVKSITVSSKDTGVPGIRSVSVEITVPESPVLFRQVFSFSEESLQEERDLKALATGVSAVFNTFRSKLLEA